MLSEKLKKQIIKIEYLFNNYTYMKKNKKELLQIKTNINDIINILNDRANDAMIDLAFKYNQYVEDEELTLNSKLVIDAGEFYENCANVKSRFKNFLNKLERRISTLEIDMLEHSDAKKDKLYYTIKSYIEDDDENQSARKALEKILIENIIDVNYVPPFNEDDDEYKVPLIIIACQKNNLNIVKMLYNNKADINININTDFIDDTTPLLAAVTNTVYNIELIRYLLDNGASPNFANLLGETPLNEVVNNEELYEEMIVKYHADVNFNYGFSTILHYACQKRNIMCIKILLNNNVNIEITDQNGASALHCLIRTFFEQEIDDIKEIVELFLAKNFNINFQDNNGNTILHQSAMQPSAFNIIKYLLDKGCNVNITNIYGNTPLHCFISELSDIVFKPLWLLDIRDSKYDNSDQLLRNAIENIKIIIDLFIIKNFNINLQNYLGETVLHQSIITFVDIKIIKHLLDCGALSIIQNNDGKTASQLAIEYGNIKIFNIISNYHNNN